MEKLASVCHVLYNRDLIEKAKTIKTLEASIVRPPQIINKNWKDWDKKVDDVYYIIKNWIIECVDRHYNRMVEEGFVGGEDGGEDYCEEFAEVIYDSLFALSNNKRWSGEVTRQIIASITIHLTTIMELRKMTELFPTKELMKKYLHKTVRIFLGGKHQDTGGMLFEVPFFTCSYCGAIDSYYEGGLCYDCDRDLLDSPVE